MAATILLYDRLLTDIVDYAIIPYIYKNMLSVIIAENSFILAKDLFLPSNTEETYRCWRELAVRGDVRTLEFLYKYNPDSFTYGVVFHAIDFRQFNVLKWAHSIGKKIDNYALEIACMEGRLDIVTWLVEIGLDCTLLAVARAARRGHLDIVKYLYPLSKNDKTCTNIYLLDEAVEGGSLECVAWLHEQGARCTQLAMCAAARLGYLSIVQYLHTNRKEGCNSGAMDSAAENGHLDIVKYLHDHRAEGCTTQAMDCAALHDTLEVIKWLHKHRTEGCTIWAMNHAVRKGNLEMVKWLYKHRLDSYSSYATAADLSVINYVVTDSVEACVVYLRDREWDSKFAKLRRWARFKLHQARLLCKNLQNAFTQKPG